MIDILKYSIVTCSLLATLGIGFVPVDAGPPPTLARISFWLPPERLSEFEVEYERICAPVLDRLGLKNSAGPGQALSDNVFTRLFAFDTQTRGGIS